MGKGKGKDAVVKERGMLGAATEVDNGKRINIRASKEK